MEKKKQLRVKVAECEIINVNLKRSFTMKLAELFLQIFCSELLLLNEVQSDFVASNEGQ